MRKATKSEAVLWAIAFPGFGQLLNEKIIKGIVFIILEFTINIQANLNTIIIPSFHGDIELAIQLTNYQWLMFYPCIYLFSIWDAYRDAGGGNSPLSFLPFVFSAFFGTIGVVYSPTFKIFGVLLGPIFLPIFFFLIGFIVGFVLLKVLNQVSIKKH